MTIDEFYNKYIETNPTLTESAKNVAMQDLSAMITQAYNEGVNS